MSEYMHLVGAEQVSSAAYTMREAASNMQRAADSMGYNLEQHQRFLDDWLGRFEAAVDRLKENDGKDG